MSEAEQKPMPTKVFLANKSSIGNAAVSQLRKAGHTVICVNDINGIKRYPDNFDGASTVAKIKAFEHALNQNDDVVYKSSLRTWYIFYLKEQKAF